MALIFQGAFESSGSCAGGAGGAPLTWNSSRTMRAPSPTYFCTSSLPITRMKHASVRFATARASSVFPVPAQAAIMSPHGCPNSCMHFCCVCPLNSIGSSQHS